MTLVASASARALTPKDVRERVTVLLKKGAEAAFLRHVTAEQFQELREVAPNAEHHLPSGLVVLARPDIERDRTVAVVSAGTSDLPVADEAIAAATAFGLRAERLTDVGVAGLHRIVAVRPVLRQADFLIVVAGMDGALPSMVARMTDQPVVAVPTSVGYGASFGGAAALLALLTADTPGLAVTGIDDGLSAAVIVRRFLR